MTNNGIVSIHGKDYMTVAKRVELAHKDGIDAIETEVLQHAPVVVVRATVTVKGKTYTGISSANPAKAIEKSNPYEVAETSAVGRALGFANYGIIEGIASADEMAKSPSFDNSDTNGVSADEEPPFPGENDEKVCSAHDIPFTMLKGFSKSKVDKDGNPKAYWYHKEKGKMCFGDGFRTNTPG